jgi:8-amino-7-oxononanoate synthase
MKLDDLLAAELRLIEEARLRRSLAPEEPGLLNFASNDYLGLRRHPALIEAARAATQLDGAGAGASRLVGGNSAAMLALEENFAAWKEKEAALLFTSGYAAALGTIPALMHKGDTIIADKLAHACLIDAARLSGATLRVFPHNHLDRLEALLRGAVGRTLVVTESIFSMDGDAAPLAEIVRLKEQYGAWLLVDEAHATGLHGQSGAGLLAAQGLSARVEIVMATMGKALGGVGGMIAGSRTLIDFLVNRARSFVFSTGLPPGVVAANAAGLAVVRGAEGVERRQKLVENIALFHAGLAEPWRSAERPGGAIQPLLCGEAGTALQFSSALRKRGFFIPAIRYPTVARGAARLRVTLSAAHTSQEVEALTQALRDLAP